MKPPEHVLSHFERLGIADVGEVHYNLKPAVLTEHAVAKGEGELAEHGPLVVKTAPHTGRSPNDRFVVEEPSTQDAVGWGKVNKPISAEVFEGLRRKMADYARGRDLYVQDLYAGADERYRLPVRIITQKAWHSLFAYNMFIRRHAETLKDFEPGFTVVDLCEFKADPETDGTRSQAFVIINFAEKLVLIGGTHYGGEIKKSIFSVMNFLLPERDVMPMHCSANIGASGDTALFFGLSGTGKTTLSADPERTLIGDDEHGWSADGVFNFEGGCYAKMIHLSPEGEPEIYDTTRRFGTILENVILEPETRSIDFDDATITENTRGSYPIHYIPNASPTGKGGHPQNVVFLTYDAFGVLPPISRLTPDQAMYHFLSGYTAKVAGTERGVTEPQPNFSACFGEPFMVRPPAVYAELLGKKIEEHDTRCWLVNTGMTGGAYGKGSRMKLKHTRMMVNAALAGDLDDVETETEPIFGLSIPKEVPGVPAGVLNPRDTWENREAYDRQARKLADMFMKNFERYADSTPEHIMEAGPQVESAS